MDQRTRNAVARRAAFLAFCALTLAVFLGLIMLKAWNISNGSLILAAGVIVTLLALLPLLSLQTGGAGPWRCCSLCPRGSSTCARRRSCPMAPASLQHGSRPQECTQTIDRLGGNWFTCRGTRSSCFLCSKFAPLSEDYRGVGGGRVCRQKGGPVRSDFRATRSLNSAHAIV